MKHAAVICEWDPFHLGHEYLLSEAKRLGAESVTGILSGPFCQRGEPSFLPKHSRARAALGAGADLVLELPFPYAAAGAEFFAAGAMGVLAAVKEIDTLVFGCTAEDARTLFRAAERMDTPLFRERAEEERDAHPELGTPALLRRVYDRCFGGGELLDDPNNVLALEYIRQAGRAGLFLSFLPIRRKGAAHRDKGVTADGYASASYLREAAARGDAIDAFLPSASADALHEADVSGQLSRGWGPLGNAVLTHFRTRLSSADTAGMRGGLYERVCRAADASRDFDEFFSVIRTKRYTDAHLRRAILFSLCGVTEDDLRAPVGYTTLLASDRVGLSLLSGTRQAAAIPILSKAGELSLLEGGAVRQSLLARRAEALRTLTESRPSPTERELLLPPVIVD